MSPNENQRNTWRRADGSCGFRSVYRERFIGKSPPASEVREPQLAAESATGGEVWVNTRSGKYFKPGSRYYGKTKEGKFVTELDALDSGYLPESDTGR